MKSGLPGLKSPIENRQFLLWALYLIIAVGYVYRSLYIIDFNPISNIFSDTERHWVQGISTLQTDPMTLTDPVGYQIFIAFIGKLTLQEPALVAFYTILLSLLAPWTWYRFFRELQPGKVVATVGWAVITWLPSWNAIYGYFMQETLMIPLLGLSLYATWRCRRKRTLSSFLTMILIWSLTGLTRAICIPLAAVATIWVWTTQDGKIKKSAYGILLLTVILGPLTYRGYQTMHIFAPYGVGHMNYIYAISGKKEINITYTRDGAVWYFGFMSPSMLIRPLEPVSNWMTRREGIVHVKVDLNEGMKDWYQAFHNNALTLDRYLWITKENIVFLMFGPSWPDSNHERTLGEINYLSRWIWAPASLICLALFMVCRRSRQRRYLLLPSIILVWFVLQALTPIVVNEGRYRKPFEGLLIAQFVLIAGTCRRRQIAHLPAAPDDSPADSGDTCTKAATPPFEAVRVTSEAQ